jgi:alkylation response protein AidB-like acyl-CoA dehydrogenase
MIVVCKTGLDNPYAQSAFMLEGSRDDIRNKLATVYMETEMARLIRYKAAWCLDTGRPDIRAILMSKIIASKPAYTVTYEAVQIHGGVI